MSQSCEASAPINKLPIELFEKIIREYSTVSITLQRNSAMNFLVTCPLWRDIGLSRQDLFRSDRLVISGHEELQQLLALYNCAMIPRHITSLAVTLSPTHPHPSLSGSDGPRAVMVQIQQDLTALRTMIIRDWDVASPEEPFRRNWKTLKLDRFSLYVNLSAVSAHRPLIQGWIRHWVYRVGEQWHGMGGKAARGFIMEDSTRTGTVDRAWSLL